MNILHICPPHLSDVATLPWESQKSHCQQYYSHILQVSSEENKLQLLSCSLAVYLLLFGASWGTLQEERVNF